MPEEEITFNFGLRIKHWGHDSLEEKTRVAKALSRALSVTFSDEDWSLVSGDVQFVYEGQLASGDKQVVEISHNG